MLDSAEWRSREKFLVRDAQKILMCEYPGRCVEHGVMESERGERRKMKVCLAHRR